MMQEIPGPEWPVWGTPPETGSVVVNVSSHLGIELPMSKYMKWWEYMRGESSKNPLKRKSQPWGICHTGVTHTRSQWHSSGQICLSPSPLLLQPRRSQRCTVSGRWKVAEPSSLRRGIVKIQSMPCRFPTAGLWWRQGEAGEIKVFIFIIQDLLILCLKIRPFNIWKGLQINVNYLSYHPGAEKEDLTGDIRRSKWEKNEGASSLYPMESGAFCNLVTSWIWGRNWK